MADYTHKLDVKKIWASVNVVSLINSHLLPIFLLHLFSTFNGYDKLVIFYWRWLPRGGIKNDFKFIKEQIECNVPWHETSKV